MRWAEVRWGHGRGEDGQMVFRFVGVPPLQSQAAGTAYSRQISAGIFLSEQRLQGVRTITVRGRSNERSSRR